MHISAPRFVSALHFFKHTVNLTCKKRSTCSAIRKDTSERSERGVNRGDTSQVQDCVEVILTSVYPRGYQGGKVENKFPGEGIRGVQESCRESCTGETWGIHEQSVKSAKKKRISLRCSVRSWGPETTNWYMSQRNKKQNALPKTQTTMTEINNDLFFLTINASLFFHEQGEGSGFDSLPLEFVEHLMTAADVLRRIQGKPLFRAVKEEGADDD